MTLQLIMKSSGQKAKFSSFVSFDMGCYQKVWPRFRIRLPVSLTGVLRGLGFSQFDMLSTLTTALTHHICHHISINYKFVYIIQKSHSESGPGLPFPPPPAPPPPPLPSIPIRVSLLSPSPNYLQSHGPLSLLAV